LKTTAAALSMNTPTLGRCVSSRPKGVFKSRFKQIFIYNCIYK
jgi:hypothetical protein